MRVALPASAALHIGLIVAAWAFLHWPESDDASLESLSVEILSLEEFTSNAPSEVQSVATENLIAAGADTPPELEPEPIEPTEAEVQPRVTEPVKVAAVEDLTPELPKPEVTRPLETLEPIEEAEIEPKPPAIEPVDDVDPTEVASIEPITPKLDVPAGSTINVPEPAEVVPIVPSDPADPVEVASLPVLTATITAASPAEGLLPLVTDLLPADTVAAVIPAQEVTPVEPPPTDLLAAATPPTLPDAPAAPQRVAELDAKFDPMRPVTAVPTTPMEVEPVETATTVAMVEAVRPVELEPLEVTEFETAPVPRTRTVEQRKEPTFPEPKPKEPEAPKKKAAEEPAKKQAEEKPRKKVATVAPGSGGDNAANSAAAPRSGGKGKSDAAGNAAVSKYPGLVQQKLRRALRYPKTAKGAEGEVQVRFVVAANGQPSNIRVVRSSGNAALDDAAVDTVRRAGPFPAIPAAAGRTSWDFTMPLSFRK